MIFHITDLSESLCISTRLISQDVQVKHHVSVIRLALRRMNNNASGKTKHVLPTLTWSTGSCSSLLQSHYYSTSQR